MLARKLRPFPGLVVMQPAAADPVEDAVRVVTDVALLDAHVQAADLAVRMIPPDWSYFDVVAQPLMDAYPGDIIGIHNHGTISIGDSFFEKERLSFTGICILVNT